MARARFSTRFSSYLVPATALALAVSLVPAGSSSAAPGDSDPSDITPICEVMGPGLRSPLAPEEGNSPGEVVTTTGIVYAAQTEEDFGNGFWMQMPDDDPARTTCPDGSSRGIYVFLQSPRDDTPAMPEVGSEVVVTAPVSEYFDATQLQANNPSGFDVSVEVVSTGNPLPEPTPIDVDEARAQDADQLYYASLHQQRVELEHGQTYVGTNKFDETFLVPGETDERVRRTDDRFDLLALDDQFLPDGGALNLWAFDEVQGAVGPLSFSFENHKLVVEDADGVEATHNQQDRPHPILEQPADTLGFATWNVENIFGDPAVITDEEGVEVLAPSDLDEDRNPIAQPDNSDQSVVTPSLEERQHRRDKVAVAMVENLNLPAVVGVQEIANETLLTQMADRINEELDARGLEGKYEARLIPGNDERFIDVGYLVDTSRVEVGTVEQVDADAPASAASPEEAEATGHCAAGPGGSLLHDRVPLRIDVTAAETGETFTMITVHNKSRSGGTAENQEFEPCRVDQAQSVIDYLDAEGLDENVIIGGDLNTFRNSPTLDPYAENGLVNMVDLIPEDRRFSYAFEGRAQFLDHLIVTPDMTERMDVVDSPKIVNDAPVPQESGDGTTGTGSSDHDPLVGYVALGNGGDPQPDPATVEFGKLPAEVLAGVPVAARLSVEGARGSVKASVVDPNGEETKLHLVRLPRDRYLTLVPTSHKVSGTYTIRVEDDSGEIGSATFAARSLFQPPPDKTVDITLLHDTHFHGGFGPGDGANIARYATQVDELKAGNPNALFLGNGDDLAPSVLAGVFQGEHMIEALNVLPLEVDTFGNHEFDFGPENLRQRIAESEFPWVTANVRDIQTGKPFAADLGVERFVLREVQGVTVGVTGLGPERMDEVTSLGDKTEQVPAIEAMTEVVPEMKAAGADVVVVTSHLCGSDARELAAAVEGIDAIVGDHCAQVLDEPEVINDTIVSFVGDEYDFVGELTLSVRKDRKGKKGDVIDHSFTRHEVTADLAPDPDVQAIVDRWEAELDEALGEEIGFRVNEWDVRTAEVRSTETGFANYIVDAIRASVGADIALQNGGGIRSDQVFPGSEPITRRDVVEVLPFFNRVVVVEMDGATILEALENSVSAVETGDGRFAQVSGLTYLWDPDASPGERIVEVVVGGEPLDPAATYTLATNDFLLGGGDGYDMLANGEVIVPPEVGNLLSEVVTDQIISDGDVEVAADGRITTVGG